MSHNKIYLVVTPFFPEPDDYRGPYVLDQVKALMRVSDYEVVVVKPYSFWKRADDYMIDGVRVLRCPLWSLPSNVLPNGLSDALSVLSLKHKLKKTGIVLSDIVACHSHVASMGFYSVGLQKSVDSCKGIVQHHGFDVMGISDGVFAKMKWHEKLCIRRGVRICNAVYLNVGVSHKVLEYLRSYSGVRLQDEYVLYNGVDSTKFYPEQGKAKNDKFTIGCIANFWPLKDQMTLIKAVERLVADGQKDLFVRFIGTGETRCGCEKYVAEHGMNNYFCFEDEVAHDHLLVFYQSLDLFVLPSYWEAFGCVYTEAYACGVPFIGVKGQGISEMIPVKDQDRWLINKGDDKGLAELIAEFIHSPCPQQLSNAYKIDDLVGRYVDYFAHSQPRSCT